MRKEHVFIHPMSALLQYPYVRSFRGPRWPPPGSTRTDLLADSSHFPNLEGSSSDGHWLVLLQCTPQISIGCVARPLITACESVKKLKHRGFHHCSVLPLLFKKKKVKKNCIQFSPPCWYVFTFFDQSSSHPNGMLSIHFGTAVCKPSNSLLVN